MDPTLDRRAFLKRASIALGGTALGASAWGQQHAEGENPPGTPAPLADRMIVIWLPGGVSQVEYWDPKPFTPYEQGMKGADLLSPCRSVPTPVDGVRLGEGLEHIASVMDKGSILRTVGHTHARAFDHTSAMRNIITAYPPTAGFPAPSLGSKLARVLGPREPNMPPYMVLGRNSTGMGNRGLVERMRINALHGPGFYGMRYGPFIVHDPEKGLDILSAVSGMQVDRLDRRQAYLSAISGMTAKELREANRVKEYMSAVESARGMLDSPVKNAFKFREEEPERVIDAYDSGHPFGMNCLLARRLIERGARYVQVEHPYKVFGFFDTHRDGAETNMEMKKRIDKPIAQLVRELDERGLLDRTLVVILSEFGRTLARLQNPSDPIAFATGDSGQVGGIIHEYSDGHDVQINEERMYGMHGHFPRCFSVVFFGGGIKRGFVLGKSADRHPMRAVEDPVTVTDLHATLYRVMGIAPDFYYDHEGRPIYMTELGKGKVVDALLA